MIGGKCAVPLVLMVCLLSAPAGQAAVEVHPVLSLKSAASPLATAVSADGRWFFVLTDKAKVEVYEASGALKETIPLQAPADQIVSSPTGDRLFLTDKKSGTTAVVELRFVQNIETVDSPFKGSEKAPVVVVVFSDFQCPYCAKVPALLEQILSAYPKDVKVVFKNFPLQMHQFARPAAIAGLAAHRQGKFWPMHDKMFESYKDLSETKLIELAKAVGLDLAKFDTDRKDPQLQEQVQRDMQNGATAEVRGTPTLFVNGRRLTERSFEGMRMMVEEELRRLQANK